MRYRLATIVLLSAAALLIQDARAQQAAPEPIVQVTVDPPRVVVGQRTRLDIVVLAPNYMTSPPELPDFQLRNAVTRQLQSINTNEQRDGVSYAGVHFEYAIYPQEPGSYAVSDQKVHVKYAAEPPATREVEVALPGVSFEAFVPDAASELRPFLGATRLSVEQTIKRSSDQLKAGDAVTRTVTIKAEGTPAMLLPPHAFASIDGLKLYPTQPALEDRTDGRTDVMTSTRVDSATYMLERPGEYSLPAFDIGWWNVASGKVEVVHLDAVPLKVAGDAIGGNAISAGGSRRGLTRDGLVDFVAEHWLSALLVAFGIAVFTWFAPGLVRRAVHDRRRRRQAYLRSEAFAFSRFRRAVHHHYARTAYFALLDWLKHFNATPPRNTASAFKAVACDTDLDRELDALENELFADRRAPVRWSPRQLLRRVTVARRRLQPRARHRESMGLPQHLNPVGISTAPSYGSRKPAR
jgi:hypothetical protein